jgi:predicted DNA binding protein
MGSTSKRIISLATLVLVLAFVSGCADAKKPSVAPTQTVTTADPAKALADFKTIAKASCQLAQSQGEVDSGADFVMVMTNKNSGYKDFSAAYLEKPNTYGLIWESDGFAACSDWYTFSMAEEAGQEAAIEASFDEASATYTITSDLGEFGVNHYRYSIKDGHIATSENLDDPTRGLRTVQYGNLTEDQMAILKTAVDQYLATQ